jgi:voltage-dependent potassium channel beta subunit
MEYRQLGKSGVKVSLLSLGSWLTFGNQIGDDVAEDLMKTAYDGGINFFDNAEGYHFGDSERVMGKILKKMNWDRTSYLVSSKVFFGSRRDQKPNQGGLSRKHITEACHEALNRLQVDYLDLYFCHRPDPSVPMEEIVWAMNHLMTQGKILYWGTSEWSSSMIMEAHKVAKEYRLIGPTMEQPQYNLFWRNRIELEYMDVFRTVGLGTTIWSPLAGGTLTQKYVDNIPADTRMDMRGMKWLKEVALTPERLNAIKELNELALEMDTTLAKLAIAWCAKNPNVSTVILGASKVAQLTETMDALAVMPKITEDITQRIEKIVDNKPVLRIL